MKYITVDAILALLSNPPDSNYATTSFTNALDSRTLECLQ